MVAYKPEPLRILVGSRAASTVSLLVARWTYAVATKREPMSTRSSKMAALVGNGHTLQAC